MRHLALIAALLLLSACNGSITNFVAGSKPGDIDQPSLQPGTTSIGPGSLRPSPGVVVSTAPNGAMKASITTNDRSFQMGGDMSARITLNRTRVQ